MEPISQRLPPEEKLIKPKKGELQSKIDQMKVERFAREKGDKPSTLKARVRLETGQPNPVASFPEPLTLTETQAQDLVQGTGFTLDDLPKYYNKEDILRLLRFVIDQASDIEVKTATQVFYTKIAALPQLLTADQLPNNFPSEFYLNKTKSSYFLSDLVRKYGASPEMEKHIVAFADKNDWDLSTYYVKKDKEAASELKAKKVVTLLTEQFPQYNQFIVPKFKGNLPGTQIGNPAAGIPMQEATEMLFSRGQTGKIFDMDLLEAYLNKKLEIAKKGTSNKLAVELYNLTRTLKEAGGKESIPFHALMDCLLFSTDSHVNQYIGKMENGTLEYYNIDFARTLPGHEVVRFHAAEGPKLRCFLRSLFLGHPFAELPLPRPLIDMVKNWDINEIKDKLNKQNLFGDTAAFEAMEKELNEISTLSSKKGRMNGKEKAELEDREKTAERRLADEFYGKIHPNGMALFLNRLKAAQEYVRECDKSGQLITVHDIFRRISPPIALFLDVLKRMTPHATQSLSVDFAGEGEARYLEDILHDARIQKVASEEELVRMERALKLLNAEGGTVGSYKLTMR